MGAGDLVLADVWLAVQVGTGEDVVSVVVLLLFEVVISDGASGLKSTLEIKTVIVLFFEDVLVDASPLFFQSLTFWFIVNGQSLICLGAFESTVSIVRNEDALRVTRIANVDFVIMNDCSYSTGSDIFDFFIADFDLLLINLKKSIF